jgi:hypothetical protein
MQYTEGGDSESYLHPARSAAKKLTPETDRRDHYNVTLTLPESPH